jgi:hypothetical protein
MTEPQEGSIHSEGWYPDPTGRFQLRYWDGTAWTAHVSTAGAASVDPEPLSATLAPRRRRIVDGGGSYRPWSW